MSHPITRRTALVTVAASALLAALPRQTLAATTHEIQMLNQHPDDRKLKMVFYPRIVVAEPGDTISFVATDKGHNSQSVDGMAPEGAEGWKGKINAAVEVTLDKPGFYGFQCAPHAAMGMVGLVIVKGEGMMDNLDAAKAVKQRGKAEGAWNDIWAEFEGMDLGA
ncbi:pseudoazurin [Maliponia aquimaris]|uniref:Pseudoazurin n=1 Tax=Maliponia aquimaris TaxID=1673631 RepID=A0A238KHV0_9RHOB|nr:pseudoazurin [Maliponia aquimaris]SMX42320.1 Pseudoazurin precursor [Maliponia aquimaris]